MWYPISARPGPLYPELPWTPAIELRLAHTRFDRASRHPASPGVFIDRHVQPGRRLPLPAVGRDSADVEADPARGLGLAVESGPPDAGRGCRGVLYDADDPAGRHAREWDFLQSHLDEAIRRWQSDQPLININDWYRDRRERLTTWNRCQAIARYALNWKARSARMAPSPHPVDVLLHSYHCAGAANIAAALAAVAGIPARRISTSTHSTLEFLIDGRWCWCDNIRQGLLLHPGSFQEFLADFDRQPHRSPEQVEQYARDEVFYRAPYDYGATLFWRWGGPMPEVGGEADLAAGIGLSVHYDPTTAVALYPEAPEQLFHADAGEGHWLTLGAKGSWLHAPLHLEEGLQLRRSFQLSDCADNPVQAGELRVWCAADAQLRASVDGKALDCRGIEPQRDCHHAAVFALPATDLGPGRHEFTVAGAGDVICFPDLVEPAEACASLAAPRLGSTATDPVIFPEGDADLASRPRALEGVRPEKLRLFA